MIKVSLMLAVGLVCWANGNAAERLLMSNLAGNSCTGSYLDITAKQHAVTINGLGLLLAPGTHRIELYHKMGSYVGSQTRAESWQKMVSKQVRSNGFGRVTRLDVSDFTLAPQQTVGLMVVSSHSLFYSNRANADPYVENKEIAIYANDAVCGEAFSTTIVGRVFNGAVYYNESFCFPLIQNQGMRNSVTPICL